MRALVFILALFLPSLALAQTAPSASDQVMQGEIFQQLGAKLQAQAEVITLKAQVADLTAKLDAATKTQPKADAPKPMHQSRDNRRDGPGLPAGAVPTQPRKRPAHQ